MSAADDVVRRLRDALGVFAEWHGERLLTRDWPDDVANGAITFDVPPARLLSRMTVDESTRAALWPAAGIEAAGVFLFTEHLRGLLGSTGPQPSSDRTVSLDDTGRMRVDPAAG